MFLGSMTVAIVSLTIAPRLPNMNRSWQNATAAALGGNCRGGNCDRRA